MNLIYRNSFWASVLSIVGTGVVAGGAMIVLYKADLVYGFFFILLGLPMVIYARILGDKKDFQKWWSTHVDAEREKRIAESEEEAIAVYNKYPRQIMVKKLQELNPQAAEKIRQRRQEIIDQRKRK